MFNPLKVRLMRSVCGLDVHKDSVYLCICILSEDGELIEKVFGVLTFQLHQMRDLLLAHHVEKDKIEAKVTDGVLHITLPRTAKAEKETKKIEVA